MFKCETFSSSSHACLGLVNDEKHPSLFAVVLQGTKIAKWKGYNASRTEDGLHDHGCQTADGLSINKRESVGEFCFPVIASVRVAEWGAISVGSWENKGPYRRGSVVLPRRLEGGRSCGLGNSMPGT